MEWTCTKAELIKALEHIPDEAIISSNHSTCELYADDETGRPRLAFSFMKHDEQKKAKKA